MMANQNPNTLTLKPRQTPPLVVTPPAPESKDAAVDEAVVEESVRPEFDPELKFIQVRDLSRTNVRFQQGENLFDKSRKYVGKADVAIPTGRKKVEVEQKEDKKVLIRDRGPRANGSSVAKVMSVSELKKQYATKNAKKTPSAPEALLKAQRENRRAAEAESNAA
jgi:hypothetical protein